jgi:hypothetical protein
MTPGNVNHEDLIIGKIITGLLVKSENIHPVLAVALKSNHHPVEKLGLSRFKFQVLPERLPKRKCVRAKSVVVWFLEVEI